MTDETENGMSEGNGETNGTAEQAAPEDALAAARAEAAQLKDQLLRAMAETENTRRRAQRDRDDCAEIRCLQFRARDADGRRQPEACAGSHSGGAAGSRRGAEDAL